MTEDLLREIVRKILVEAGGVPLGAQNPQSKGRHIANFLDTKYGRRLAHLSVVALLGLILTTMQDKRYDAGPDQNAVVAHAVVSLAKSGDLKKDQAHQALERAKSGRF